jgi:hypothetical protein
MTTLRKSTTLIDRCFNAPERCFKVELEIEDALREGGLRDIGSLTRYIVEEIRYNQKYE